MGMGKTVKQRVLAVLLALPLLLPLSGCSYTGFDAPTLMAPPKANSDQQSIHKLLQGTRSDITFVYPKSGAYRSAIIMRNLSESKEAAIGFYAAEGGGVEVQFLLKQEGQWNTVSKFKNAATQVDRVCFGDFDGDGTQDVLIGWGSSGGTTGLTASVSAYLCEKQSFVETALGTYGEMVLTDFDGDSVKELFTADKYLPNEEEGAQPATARGRLFAYRDGKMQEIFSAAADNTVTSYFEPKFGKLSSSQLGVVLDGAKADGSMTTQIFTLSEDTQGEFYNMINQPTGVNSEGYMNPFARPTSAFLTKDVNGDGSLEIPVATLLPGIPATVTPDSTSFLVEWSRYQSDGSRRSILPTLMNLTENYWFRLPAGLRGKITSTNDPAKHSVIYTEVIPQEEEGTPLLGSPLFSIRVFTLDTWDSRGESGGYVPIAYQGELVYGFQTLTQDREMLSLINQIKDTFTVITE